jgi:hypothetical protein
MISTTESEQLGEFAELKTRDDRLAFGPYNQGG